MTFLATLAYDGTHYFGWQKTDENPTIQGEISKAIERLTQEKVVPESASRTDRGVHAQGQVIVFSLQKDWDLKILEKALNAHLPQDIRILNIQRVPEYFHPTLQALGKEYHYHVTTERIQSPMDLLYAWHKPLSLDLNLMKQASQDFLGTHDFTSFSTDPRDNPLCTLTRIEFLVLERGILQISMTGDRFLYKMARTIAGTLIDIGEKKLAPSSIPSIFASKDRKKAGVSAPAHGLFLHRVIY